MNLPSGDLDAVHPSRYQGIILINVPPLISLPSIQILFRLGPTQKHRTRNDHIPAHGDRDTAGDSLHIRIATLVGIVTSCYCNLCNQHTHKIHTTPSINHTISCRYPTKKAETWGILKTSQNIHEMTNFLPQDELRVIMVEQYPSAIRNTHPFRCYLKSSSPSSTNPSISRCNLPSRPPPHDIQVEYIRVHYHSKYCTHN